MKVCEIAKAVGFLNGYIADTFCVKLEILKETIPFAGKVMVIFFKNMFHFRTDLSTSSRIEPKIYNPEFKYFLKIFFSKNLKYLINY